MLEELKVNDEYEVSILKQDHFGKGLVKIKNIFVFVEDALPEEICKIEITNVKKNFATARIKKYIKKSPDRVEPICPYYQICGGCHIMHQSYEKQLEFKQQKIKELLEKFTGLKNINIFPVAFNDYFYYRNKIILHGNREQLGFYQERTNDVVAIRECIIANKKINEIYKKVQNFRVDNPENFIDRIMFRITSLNEIMVIIEGNLNSQRLLDYLEEVHTVYLNDKLIKGNPYILEEIFGIKFQIYPNSFFQVNYQLMLTMYKLVIDFYKDKNYQKVLDLYCGTGTIGMLISPYVNKVIGVEIESSAVQSANYCKELNKIENIEFVEGKVEDKIDLFKNVDSIIVDPPRSGLDNHTIETILTLNPQTITYISCDPVTLARDLKILLENYELLEVHPVDMFPNTYHVECVSVLHRKKLEK